TLEKQIKCHQKNQTAYKEKIIVLSFEVDKQTNMVSYKQKLLDQASVENQDLMAKLENEKSINVKWLSTSKNLHKLVDTSMTARTKRGLGYVNLTRENDWGFGDSKPSVFNSNKEDWEGKPIYNRFTQVNHYKGVPPPMNGHYMPTSTSPDTDESPRPYGKQTSESTEIKSTSKNSNFSFDFSDQSSVPTASDSCVESARPNNVVNDSEDFPSRTSTSGSKEQFNNVCIHSLLPKVKTLSYFPQLLLSMHLANGTFGGTGVKPSAGWPWTKQNSFYSQGSKINDGLKSKSWLHTYGPQGDTPEQKVTPPPQITTVTSLSAKFPYLKKEYKASEEEGLDGGYDKMQKILSKMNTLKIKPDQEDINIKFLRGLPLSWANIAQIMKVKGGLEYMSLDDLYNKLKCLEIDTKGYSVPTSALANAAFVISSSSSSSQSKLSYQETNGGGSSAKHSASKGSSSTKSSAIDDVIYSLIADYEEDQHLAFEDLDQVNKEAFDEYEIKHQMAMIAIKARKFENKYGRPVQFDSREAARFDKKLAKCFKCIKTGHFARECRSQSLL
nr:hypothetical protein [Tanacetum cinerariifolium]